MAEENTNQAPAPGTAEHDAAMAAKFDGQSQDGQQGATQDGQAGEPTQGESLILGKFKSQDDLVAAYKALESKLGQAPADTQGGNDSTQDGQDAAAKAVSDAGLDMGALQQEFAEQGALSDESLAKLEKAGISRDIVDLYVQGQEALVSNLQNAAYAVVGGEESYKSMTQWAAANLTEAEIDTFNRAVNSTNKSVIELAVTGLKGRYEAANGSEPNLVGGDAGTATGPAFESWAQVREAMRDPKYAKDPAYRRQVEEKLGRSNPI